MSTLQKPQAKHPIKFIRPAVIEFRFNQKKVYEKQLRIFIHALKPAAADVVTSVNDSSCYFPIRVNPKGKQKEMELRFVLLKKGQARNAQTVVYWQVPSDSLKWTSDSLIYRHKFNILENIKKSIDGSSQALLGDSSSNKIIDENNSDRILGLVVNPPYPTFTSPPKGTTTDSVNVKPQLGGGVEGSSNYLVWIGCVVALLIGFMVGRLGRK